MPSNLDEVAKLREFDKNDMFGKIDSLPKQLEDSWSKVMEGSTEIELPTGLNAVLITGMGGSATGADFVRLVALKDTTVPIVINKDYNIPGFVSDKTLVIAASYSGGTEETISAYKKARERGAKLAAVTSGGQLEQLALSDGVPLFKLPTGFPPRAAFGYLFGTMLSALVRANIVKFTDQDFHKAVENLKTVRDKLSPEVPEADNKAKQLARALQGKLPLIYGASNTTEAIALRWKMQFNENTKSAAFHNVYPELDHNEILGYSEPQATLPAMYVLVLLSQFDVPEIGLRSKISAPIIGANIADYVEIPGEGDTHLGETLALVILGDYVSTYLAALYDIDPTPIPAIDHLKSELHKAKA